MSESSCSSAVERVLGKDEVTGSNPVKSSTSEKTNLVLFFLRRGHQQEKNQQPRRSYLPGHINPTQNHG